MEIINLKQRNDLTEARPAKAHAQLSSLVDALRAKHLEPAVTGALNAAIEQVNNSSANGKDFLKLVSNTQRNMLKTLEKEQKIVPKNYYRSTWMVVGMSAFGLPFGAAFGLWMKNMGLLGAGLPLGMVIGMAVGSRMDKKAAEEGRQLEFEAKPV